MNTYELQQKIHTAVKAALRPGMTELMVGEVISSVCPRWEGDLISGNRTADIEGAPTNRVIQNGDVVLLDLQVFDGESWSDLTRVYFAGEASAAAEDAYHRVERAIKAGEALLKPGTPARDIYHTMRGAIDHEYAFLHHGGHAIGTDTVVTEPRFVPESGDVLREGLVVTLEPGIYFPGEFGIRLENNYLITSEGFRRLCSLSMELRDYILKG